MNVPVDGFGDALRYEREHRGLSLDTISEQTKVQVRYLQAVEQEQYEELPGGVFRRGIVRSYVLALGLDEPEWMARYSASYQHRSTAIGLDTQADWVEFAKNVRRGRLQGRNLLGERSRLRWIGVVLMILLLAGLARATWVYLLQHR